MGEKKNEGTKIVVRLISGMPGSGRTELYPEDACECVHATQYEFIKGRGGAPVLCADFHRWVDGEYVWERGRVRELNQLVQDDLRAILSVMLREGRSGTVAVKSTFTRPSHVAQVLEVVHGVGKDLVDDTITVKHVHTDVPSPDDFRGLLALVRKNRYGLKLADMQQLAARMHPRETLLDAAFEQLVSRLQSKEEPPC